MAATRREAKTSGIKICVAALTRDRPLSLQWMLASWERLERPAGTELEFLIVENSGQSSADDALGSVNLSGASSYLHVPVPSIPAARNAAIDFAVSRGADLLAFVDDDESVDPSWLAELVATWRETGALLIGGPVLAAMPDEELRPAQMSVFRAIEKRCERKAAAANRLHRLGRDACITMVTANWLGHVDLFTRYGLRFAENLALASGSDAAFDYEVRRRGLSKAWSPRAIVRETVAPSRLSLSYQMRRARDQSNSSFRRKLARSRFALVSELPAFVFRLLALVTLAAAASIFWSRVNLPLARTAGWLWGRLLAVFGAPPCLYAVVRGDAAGREPAYEPTFGAFTEA